MKQFSVNVSQFSAKKDFFYKCEFCDLKCIRKNDYIRHLSTSKHKKRKNETNLKQNAEFNEKSVNNSDIGLYCECGDKFNSRTTLWRHRKKCEYKIQDNDESYCNINNITNDIVLEFMKQNKEFQKQIFDFIKTNPLNVNSNNIINNNSNNKTFNLQVFLNETCKDALNIDEFIDSLKISFSDLENVGETGFVNGISKIFVNGLKSLDVCKRPIHCSDLKRETMYMKEKNVWEKDNETKDKLKKVINMISHKNMLKVNDWKDLHPQYKDSDSKKNDQYLKILIGVAGPTNKEDEDIGYNKIIRNIAKEVTIDKINGF